MRSAGNLLRRLAQGADVWDKEKLKRDKVHSCSKATDTHYEVGTKVRKAIEDIGGTMPENLPTPEKSIKQVEKEQLRRLKDKKTKLMLDE